MNEKTINGIKVLNQVPEGWKVLGGANRAPVGYRFICNNKSRFGDEYEHALVPEDIAYEWWFNNT
jgi:hypothetical protein